MPSDPEKALERARRYRAKKRSEKYGPDAPDMRGRHGNHATGADHPRWSGGIYRTSHGYVALAVPVGHHLRQAHGYAYEHDLVLEAKIGRELEPNETAHHENGVRHDNRPENLTLKTRAVHARDHILHRPRDKYGRITERDLPPPARGISGRFAGSA